MSAGHSPAPRSLVALALGLASIAAACSAEEPGDRPEAILRVAELDPGFTPPPQLPLGRPLVQLGDDPEAWQSLIRLQREPTPSELDAFATSSRIEGDAIVIGPCQGAWYRTVPVRGGETIVLRGRVEVQSVSGAPEAAVIQAGIAEFSRPLSEHGTQPDATQPDGALAELVDEIHLSRPFGAPAPLSAFTVIVTLAPETHTVGIVLSQNIEDEASIGGARFTDLELSTAGVYTHAALASGDPELAFQTTGGARGNYTIGRAARDGLALPLSSSARWRLSVPAGAARFEAWAGLVPHDDFAPDRGVRFRAEWLDPGADAPLAAVERVLRTDDVRSSRWQLLEVEVPAMLRGRPGVLQLAAVPEDPGAASVEAEPTCLPVFANPRVVPVAPRRVGPNIVLVSLDTLRADHVGTYGYERDTTPHIDALASESLVFEDVWAQGPYTLPSHMSLLSGQHPSVHAVQSDSDARDPLRTPLLAELLHTAGWSTAAFTGGGYVHPMFGFGGGFELFFSQDLEWNRESTRIREALESVPDVGVALAESATMDDVRDWLGRHRGESFFLFFHTYAAHEFDPPAAHLRALGLDETGLSQDPRARSNLGIGPDPPERPPAPEAVQRLVDLYDGAVRQADSTVGVLVETLRELELWDDTIFVVVSDHGQEIGERGLVGHGHTLYEEMLQVPLVVRIPGAAPGRVSTPAMLVDVAPTLLHALELRVQNVQGADLRTLSDDRRLYAEVDHAAVKTALRSGALKTIHGPAVDGLLFPNEHEEETFDLAADPGERARLTPDAARVRKVEELRAQLRALSADLASGHVAGGAIGAELRAQLEALGYGVSAD